MGQPDPDKLARFTQAVQRLTGSLSGKIGLAVSGGPDSLAMLLLAHKAFPGRIVAATVDHGLRPEAAAEADYVADVCRDHAIAHSTLRPASPITGNIQSAARKIRYALLLDWAKQQGCAWVATAHHGDDQLETLLMRLTRGSGVDGLAAIRISNGAIIRPMLGFSKTEIEDICADARIEPVRDPSNDDSDFDRVAMRQWLASTDHPFTLARIGRSTAALADAVEALDWMTTQLSTEYIGQDGPAITLNPASLPREIQRRLLLLALRKVDSTCAPRGDAIDRALDALPRGKKITLGEILCEGGTLWRFSLAPPRRTV